MTRHTAASLAERLGGRLVGAGETPVSGVNSVSDAGPLEATFISDRSFLPHWDSSRAKVAVVSASIDVAGHESPDRTLIVVPDAELAMVDLLEVFSPPKFAPAPGVHPTAVIEPGVSVGEGVAIGPLVAVGPGCVLGSGAVLHPGVRLYPNVTLGEGCILHSNVVIRERCTLGKRVVLHAGVAIGTDGFGYRAMPGSGEIRKIAHIGTVIIEDDVEIGANACVDRAKFGATVVGAGSKIDNLVQIGHNCRIGRGCVIAGLAALAGSVKTGDGVQIGGCAGIAEHVTIGAGARIAGGSGVISDVEAGAKVFGLPAGPIREQFRQKALLGRVREWMAEVSDRLERLERGSG